MKIEKESHIVHLKWYNKPLASATLVAVPPGGKSAELDPNPNYYYYSTSEGTM
jgi:hypothetical protein